MMVANGNISVAIEVFCNAYGIFGFGQRTVLADGYDTTAIRGIAGTNREGHRGEALLLSNDHCFNNS
jgi:hypothetical protein